MTTMDDGHGDLVQPVGRAQGILEALAALGESGVGEIGERLGVHRSTAFRLISTLQAHDLVEQTGVRGRYRLGVGVLPAPWREVPQTRQHRNATAAGSVRLLLPTPHRRPGRAQSGRAGRRDPRCRRLRHSYVR